MNIIQAIVSAIIQQEKEQEKYQEWSAYRQTFKGRGRYHQKPSRSILLARRKRERQNRRRGRMYV